MKREIDEPLVKLTKLQGGNGIYRGHEMGPNFLGIKLDGNAL